MLSLDLRAALDNMQNWQHNHTYSFVKTVRETRKIHLLKAGLQETLYKIQQIPNETRFILFSILF